MGRPRVRVRAAPTLVAVLALAGMSFIASGTGDDRLPESSDPGPKPSTTLPESVASGPLRFADDSRDSGVQAGFEPESEDIPGFHYAGVAVDDIDGDLDLDLVRVGTGAKTRVYANDGTGRFENVTDEAGLTGGSEGTAMLTFADLDQDGDLDAYALASPGDYNRLYTNDGRGHFTDVTADFGLPTTVPAEPNSDRLAAVFDDWDLDGDLDLLSTHWDKTILNPYREGALAARVPPPDQSKLCRQAREARAGEFVKRSEPNLTVFWRNDGEKFTDITATTGVDLGLVSVNAIGVADVDGDGRNDFLIGGEHCSSTVLKNLGDGRFEDLRSRYDDVLTDENAMGAVPGDLNADGITDWIITSIFAPPPDGQCLGDPFNVGCTGNRALVMDGKGGMVDATDRLGLRATGWGWGAAIQDFGNDGGTEVAVVNGVASFGGGVSIDERPEGAYYGLFDDDPISFFERPSGAERFVDAAQGVGLLNSESGRTVAYGLVPADLDGDGDLDMVVANRNAPLSIFRNDLPAGRAWLTVRLDDPKHPKNRRGLGAVVTIEGAGQRATSLIQTGGAFVSHKPPTMHLGFGDVTDPSSVAVTVTVRWPGEPEPQVVELSGVNRDVVITHE